jgi:protein translocase SecG subunit
VTTLAVLAFSIAPIAKGILMALFILSGLLLAIVVLLQEGKGGGIAGAFGGAAGETFGVKAGSVNRFTSVLAGVFILIALTHAGISAATESVIAPAVTPEGPPAPAAEPVPAMDGTPPAMDTTPPAMTDDKPPTPPGTPPATPPAPAPGAPPAPAPTPAPAPGMNPPEPAPAPTPPPAPAMNPEPVPAGMGG